MSHDVADGRLEGTRQDVPLEQDPVLQGLVPALDLDPRLGVNRRAADMLYAFILEPDRVTADDVGRADVTEQSGPVRHGWPVATRGFGSQFERVGDGEPSVLHRFEPDGERPA